MKHTKTNINPVAADAISTFIPYARTKGGRKKNFKQNNNRTIYALIASDAQFENDPRLGVIEDFVKGLRKHKYGATRAFIIDTLYNGIVARANEAAKQTPVDNAC